MLLRPRSFPLSESCTIADRHLWVARRTELRPGLVQHVVIISAGRPLTFAEVMAGWCDSADFRAFFIAELAATPFPAYFWEMPPIRRKQTDSGYEYVAIRSDILAGLPANSHAFESKFGAGCSARPIASFRNIGGDALLVAPRPIGKRGSYGHLAAFVRTAPEDQRHELLRTLGRALRHTLRICAGGLWTSTSGLGVPWLHLRLDSIPKYYNHRPFADA